jgi:hypothetical protein
MMTKKVHNQATKISHHPKVWKVVYKSLLFQLELLRITKRGQHQNKYKLFVKFHLADVLYWINIFSYTLNADLF